MNEKVEKALTDAGVFLGQDGLEKFANADEFWDHTPADRHSATAPCPVEAAEDSAAEWDRMERKVRDIAWLAKCVRDQILSMRDDANRFDEGTAHGVNWKHDPGNILRSHAHWLEKMLQQLELRS